MGAPYPVFLAVGGALLAFVPGAPTPHLASRTGAGLVRRAGPARRRFDASLRDLRDNWAPLASLVVVRRGPHDGGGRGRRPCAGAGPAMGAAIALGAIVAPPDAVAATAVLRSLRPPQRVLTILEGESLLNDASALLIYRLAVARWPPGASPSQAVAPAFLLAVLGSIVAGPALGWLVQRLLERVQHIPTAIILQFVSTFTVWVLAEKRAVRRADNGLLRHDARPTAPRAPPHGSASPPTRCGPR